MSALPARALRQAALPQAPPRHRRDPDEDPLPQPDRDVGAQRPARRGRRESGDRSHRAPAPRVHPAPARRRRRWKAEPDARRSQTPPRTERDAPPRAGARDLRSPRRALSRRALRARLQVAVPAARRDDPQRAVHRQAREHGHARAVQALPHAGGARRRQAGGARGDHQVHRLLPKQDEEPARHVERGRRAARRQGSGRRWTSW